MVVASLFNRPLARQSAPLRAVLPVAVAAVAAQLALPNVAMAQTMQAAGGVPCEVMPADRPIALAMATTTRVEPGAGPAAVAPMSSSKASAILGGAVSKLEQMRSVQVPGQAVAFNLATTTTRNLQTASNCNRSDDNFASPPVSASASFKDAILGAQSVAIARTPFDHDWAAVQTRQNNVNIQKALAKSGARGAADKARQIQMVNRWVNQNIAFGDDQVVYRRADYWAPASETLRRGIGDCEDFAITKMDMLAALGVARADMRLIIARDLVRNADHAVLVVKMDGSSVMLDNVTDRLLDGSMPNDYRPIMSFSQNAKWVHGYGVQQPSTVRMASLPAVTVQASTKAHDVIAVTTEPELPVISIASLSAPLVLPTLL